jgi:hypothetical protein
MKASRANAFKKTLACPSSTILLSFRLARLSSEVSSLVSKHLAECDFCPAEVTLLEHHTSPAKRVGKAPDLPINLRILAESILSQSKRIKKTKGPRHGLRLND